MATTVSLQYRVGGVNTEDLTSYVYVEDGISLKRGKQTAFGATEITTCEFSVKREIMKTVAWRLVTRTNQDIQLTVNGSVRFTGWWHLSDEDIFDDRGILRITLASTGLKRVIEDTRKLRYSTRDATNIDFGLHAYLPIDPGLLELDRWLDNQGPRADDKHVVINYSEDPSGTRGIQDPPSSIPQLRSGPRNTFTTDARYGLSLYDAISPPFKVFWVMNASPTTIKAASAGQFIKVKTEYMSFAVGISATGNLWYVCRNEEAGTTLATSTDPWATRNTSKGELWSFVLEVTTSGANVTASLLNYPIGRLEGNLQDYNGQVQESGTYAAPTSGVGKLATIEFGPYAAGLYNPEDLLLSDIIVISGTALDGYNYTMSMLGGLRSTALLGAIGAYWGCVTSAYNGTFTVMAPTIPPGTGAEHIAAIEEVNRSVVSDSRTEGSWFEYSKEDYVPVVVTELALGDDYLRSSGSGGEEGELAVLVPDTNYPIGVSPYGAQWQRNRSKKWARLPVLLDSANKRSVDVGTSYVSFNTRPGNRFAGRVVGIEEQVTPATHTAFWVIEEYPHKDQIKADSAVARASDGSAKAALVNASYSGGGTVTVDATYSAYDLPFTVRPAAASKYKLVISGVAGTTWTINTGASTLPPSMAVGDVLNFDNAAIAF